MPEVSAAIIVVAGSIMVVAGVMPSSLTEGSRQRMAGIGYMLCSAGVIAWLVAFSIALVAMSR